MVIQDLILAIINVSPCSKVKLAKLILFIEREYYALHGKSLTGNYYVKMPHGPVPANFDLTLSTHQGQLWNLKKEELYIHSKKDNAFKHTYTPLVSNPVPEEISTLISNVIAQFDDKSGSQLSELSHQLPAWKYSEPGEPIYISELIIESESEYFKLQELAEEIETEEDEKLYADLSEILP